MEEITNCPVCARGYNTDKNSPMLLPCSHSVCNKCVEKKLLRKNQVECPQCSATHGKEAVGTNKYILTYIKNVPEPREPRENCKKHSRERNLFCIDCKTAICVLCLKDEHRNHDFGDLQEVMEENRNSLLMNVESLKKNLETNKEKLVKIQEKVRKNCENCVEEISQNKEKQIKRITKRAEQLINLVKDETVKTDQKLQIKIEAVSDGVAVLDNIEETTNTKSTHSDIERASRKFENTSSQMMECLSAAKKYNFLKYENNETLFKYVKKLCGEIEVEEKAAKLSKISAINEDKREAKGPSDNEEIQRPIENDEQVAILSDNELERPSETDEQAAIENEKDIEGPRRRNLEVENGELAEQTSSGVSAKPSSFMEAFKRKLPSLPYDERSPIQDDSEESGAASSPSSKKARYDGLSSATYREFRVSESFDIEMNYAQNMCLPNKQTVLLFGMQYVKGHEDWRLFRYHRSRKRLLNCMEIPECKPDGMAMITMSGNPRLALSYGKMQRIVFYSLSKLKKIYRSFSVAPYHPGAICALESSTLLFLDRSGDPQVIRYLDCRRYPPQFVELARSTRINQNLYVQDMCCTKYGDGHLVVATHNFHGVDSYNTSTNALEWNFQGVPPGMNSPMNAVGVAIDDRGYVYVCDQANCCIQMLSLDGRYHGAVLRYGERGLGEPMRIRFCDQTSSLVVTGNKDDSQVTVSIFSSTFSH